MTFFSTTGKILCTSAGTTLSAGYLLRTLAATVGVVSFSAAAQEQSLLQIPGGEQGGGPEYKQLLSQFTPLSEDHLLREAGLPIGPAYESAVEDLVMWISTEGVSPEKTRLSRRCEALLKASKITLEPLSSPTVETLACTPWQLERLAAAGLLRKFTGQASTPPIRNSAPVRKQEDWNTLKGVAFTEAFRRVDAVNIPSLQKAREYSVSTATECEYAGANAALIARAEALAPDPIAYQVIFDAHTRVTPCMKPEDDGFERTHLRVGLMHLMQGDKEKARPALEKALEATAPTESFRTLFWLGMIWDESLSGDARKANEEKKNPYWTRLQQEMPLSFHSIVAAHAMGIDPLTNIMGSEDHIIARRSDSGWEAFGASAFVYELLIARGRTGALENWSRFVSRNIEGPTPDHTLYLAHLHNAAQNFQASISAITRYMRDSKRQNVSMDVLKMTFPTPYAEEILAQTDIVDPVMVFALIRQESAFNPQARSVADARGLMQLLPSTARMMMPVSPTDLYHPTTNIKLGVWHMNDLLKRYQGAMEHVLAAYNAGAGNVDRWRTRYPNANIMLFSDMIPFRETRNYIALISRNAYWYGRILVLQNDKIAQTVTTKSTNAKWRSKTVGNLLNVAWASQTQGQTADLGNVTALFNVTRSTPPAATQATPQVTQAGAKQPGKETPPVLYSQAPKEKDNVSGPEALAAPAAQEP